ANTADGVVEKDDPSRGTGHEPTVNADAFVDLEVNRDRIDEMLSRIGTFDPAVQTADDLQKIESIGPLLEQKLHQVGIYTFDQISRLTQSDFTLLDTLIDEFKFEGRYEEWTLRATQLKNKK